MKRVSRFRCFAAFMGLCLMIFFGCASKEKRAERNRDNTLLLKAGMTSEQVRALMGGPQRKRHFEEDEDTIDIWAYRIYWTEDGRQSERDYVKLLFRDDLLLGWGKHVKHKTVSSEGDIESGVTIDQVEKILGEPYYESGLSTVNSNIVKKFYISFKSNKKYEIAYENYIAFEVWWADVSNEIAEAKKTSDKIRYGQSMEEVISILGDPDNMTGDQINTFLWYTLESDNVIIYFFHNGILKNFFSTSMKTFQPEGHRL